MPDPLDPERLRGLGLFADLDEPGRDGVDAAAEPLPPGGARGTTAISDAMAGQVAGALPG